ncbi:MAG TPA: hypothetical protein VK988_18385 [Acidimicrobiales bacterium]|nr:hypothetical protein [Acidimicrobiales bacterium]
MPDRFEERRWLARVRHPRGTITGAAWLVDDRHLVTCAHVVTDADGAPGTTVRVEFPLLDDAVPRDATVLPQSWVPPAGTEGDIAVLA